MVFDNFRAVLHNDLPSNEEETGLLPRMLDEKPTFLMTDDMYLMGRNRGSVLLTKPILGDGNCLFTSCMAFIFREILQTGKEPSNADLSRYGYALRLGCFAMIKLIESEDYVQNNVAKKINALYQTELSNNEYYKDRGWNVLENKNYGDILDIYLISLLLRRRIVVYQRMMPNDPYLQLGADTCEKIPASQLLLHEKPIHLQRVGNNHYQLLIEIMPDNCIENEKTMKPHWDAFNELIKSQLKAKTFAQATTFTVQTRRQTDNQQMFTHLDVRLMPYKESIYHAFAEIGLFEKEMVKQFIVSSEKRLSAAKQIEYALKNICENCLKVDNRKFNHAWRNVRSKAFLELKRELGVDTNTTQLIIMLSSLYSRDIKFIFKNKEVEINYDGSNAGDPFIFLMQNDEQLVNPSHLIN